MAGIEKLENRWEYLDSLKGISIIAIILYHLGILRFGYLGVDVFFVISGFLAVPKVMKKIENGKFKYFKYIAERFFRFLPLVLIACTACLLIGFFCMLPDDYENLSESVIASTFFK